MKPLKNKVSITLDSDIIEQLKFLAEQDDRSFSQYINMILKEYLTQADKKKEASNISALCFSYLNYISFIFGMLCAYIFKLHDIAVKPYIRVG